jgi:hypothetical protein
LIALPVSVYLNWGSYDELSDTVELDETLALRQLTELLRLRGAGVRFDYYVMDAFWFAKDGGYREWRKPHWPHGPDRWLSTCLENGVKPGLWLGANNPAWMHVIPEWKDSFDPQTGCMCCFYGGYLAHYLDTLDLWYQRGIRLFKFDFADFTAAPPGIKQSLLPSEIRAANTTAYRGALKSFRQSHPDVLLLAYNGFEERTIQNSTDEPAAKVLDGRWLEVFDSIYCGDARPADVPTMNFWRSKDIYSDHMVRRYLENDVPLRRIDNAGFMIGTTGTCYWRGISAWRGMLILSLARGGHINTCYGNLELLTDGDAEWYASVQRLFFGVHAHGRTESFGGVPGYAEPYGYISTDHRGSLITMVNPGQHASQIALPLAQPVSLLFTDSGFTPTIVEQVITLGAEQMALLGTGAYAELDFGRETDVVIPAGIHKLDRPQFYPMGDKAIRAELNGAQENRLRIVVQQHDAQNRAVRTTASALPDNPSLAHLITIEVSQNGQLLPVDSQYHKRIWSGLSWAVGEVVLDDPVLPITITCTTGEQGSVSLKAAVYAVDQH